MQMHVTLPTKNIERPLGVAEGDAGYWEVALKNSSGSTVRGYGGADKSFTWEKPEAGTYTLTWIKKHGNDQSQGSQASATVVIPEGTDVIEVADTAGTPLITYTA